MIPVISKALGVSKEEAETFVEAQGGPIPAADVILSWTRDTQPIDRPIRYDLVRHARYRLILTPWAEKWKLQDTFLKEASLFECTVTCTVNPTYPTLAFRAPLAASLELASTVLEAGTTLADELLAYAILVEALHRHKTMTRDAIRTLWIQKGIPEWYEPEQLVPFPPEIWDAHPLQGVDVTRIAPAQIRATMSSSVNTIALIRERKEMCNRIVKYGDDYQLHENVESFVKGLVALNRPLAY